ncbi:homeobox protein pnx-like [Artemia franciscana]|uniref:Homeobox domain-containing protein n=2 Tax=Artemia franciscana TaxID=6661 RepID=A0AA88HXN8_ARTSF|nr:hypothetical protein QYM36_010955 [Artemia franciscana]
MHNSSLHDKNNWAYNQPIWMAAMAQTYMKQPGDSGCTSKDSDLFQRMILNRIFQHQQIEALKLKRRNAFSIESILGINNDCRRDDSIDRSEKDFDGISDGSPSPTNYFPSHYREANRKQQSLNFPPNENPMLSRSKRVRTIFSAEQLERLEAEFERQQYMVGPERLYLAASLQLTESQVKVWFQNRRIKWRKQHLEQRKVLRKSSARETETLTESSADQGTEY